ncbi:uncharacterized protein TNCV_434081 [Trichonephila clavipes]|nr:uncharacterized protein TNCV_434081 [Trichonephila clavipes]
MAGRMSDVKDLKSALLYALKVESATQASYIDRHSIREARVMADEPRNFRCMKEIEELKEEMQALKAEHQNRRRRSITCWGCGESGHLRSNCPRNNKEDRSTKYWVCGGAGHLRNNCPRVNQKNPHRANFIESKKVCSQPKRISTWKYLSSFEKILYREESRKEIWRDRSNTLPNYNAINIRIRPVE